MRACRSAPRICMLLSLRRKSESKNTINGQKSVLCFETIDFWFFEDAFLFNCGSNINGVLRCVLFWKSARLPSLFLSAVASHFGKLLKGLKSLLNIQSSRLFKSARRPKSPTNETPAQMRVISLWERETLDPFVPFACP